MQDVPGSSAVLRCWVRCDISQVGQGEAKNSGWPRLANAPRKLCRDFEVWAHAFAAAISSANYAEIQKPISEENSMSDGADLVINLDLKLAYCPIEGAYPLLPIGGGA